jgi:hypothetical protein
MNNPTKVVDIPYNRIQTTNATPGGKPKFVGPNRISQAGLGFLKCAFAPPDFQNTQVQGVPDSYRGQSLLKKHKYTGSIVLSANTDYYIILAPTPGIAYYAATTAPGVPVTQFTQFFAVAYSDFTTLFTNSIDTTTENVEAFRYVSNHFELIPTTNEMTWSGAVSTYKTPMKFVTRSGGVNTADMWAINGIEGCNADNMPQYTGPFKAGVFTGCYSASAEFPFSEIRDNIYNVPNVTGLPDFGQFYYVGSTGHFTGFDNSFETSVIKIQGLTTNCTAIFKTWACVDYQCRAGSVLNEYQVASPPCDEYALSIYREIVISLPIGVSYYENADFWQRVLAIMKSITGMASFVPGPYGMIAKGVNMLL